MKPVSLNCLTGQTKKVIYVFYGNGDSFNMIFITIIQPKIDKSNGFLKQKICFRRSYFNLFFTSKYLLSGHNSKKKQLQIFPFDRFQKQSLISFQKQSHVLQKTLKCFQKQPYNLQHKKISAKHFLSETVV